MESKLFEAMENSLQMENTTNIKKVNRKLNIANVEYFLRTMNINDMFGRRSEVWAAFYRRTTEL